MVLELSSWLWRNAGDGRRWRGDNSVQQAAKRWVVFDACPAGAIFEHSDWSGRRVYEIHGIPGCAVNM